MLSALVFSTPAHSTGRGGEKFDGDVEIVPNSLVLDGGTVFVDIDISAEKASLPQRKTLLIIPVVSSGSRDMELPAVAVMSRRMFKEYSRSMALMDVKERSSYSEPYAVLSGSDRKVKYTLSFPYEEWMKDAELDAVGEIYSCGGNPVPVFTRRLSDRIEGSGNGRYTIRINEDQ